MYVYIYISLFKMTKRILRTKRICIYIYVCIKTIYIYKYNIYINTIYI